MAKKRPPSSRRTTTPGNCSSAGCSSSSRNTCVPGSRPSSGIGGRVATEMSHSSESPIPIMTPARTPNTSVPAMAAMAIQKSKRCTRASRRISGRSIMPMTTASMIRAASTGLGNFENSGARTSKREQDDHPGGQRRQARTCPRVVVEGAGRQAGRDGHPLEESGADVGHALSHRFLVDVDAVAVLGGERPRVAGGLREADEHQARPRRGRSCWRAHPPAATSEAPRSAAPWAPRPRGPRRGRRGRRSARPRVPRPPGRGPQGYAARSPATRR